MTPWQSDAIAFIQLVFTISLWPTLADKAAQIPRTTSVVTASGMWALCGIFASLELWTAVAMSLICAFAWSFIAVYRPIKEVT